MNSEFVVTNPDDIKLQLTITTTLYEWAKLEEQMIAQWPSWQLGNEIRSMINQAKARFYPQTPKGEVPQI